ncbi:TetR/AcrR family transcriptional regulator [Phyllobacterium sp. LjRoot231]|uniref:TetR/AcrR family transcriptional regulator n=1 Tax=Phyllobacterium sp. LjRoot231 TaxID=3342289 RepID=UPI003ECF77E4
MKNWSDEHPKAKAMTRKSAAILEAARNTFLRLGYEGTNMDTIAAAAGVSIMTLYRHSEGKDDLFRAVISNTCDHWDKSKRADMAALAGKPLNVVLVLMGEMLQEKLANDETAALFRVVMAESSRFPHLAQTAYNAFIGSHEDSVERILFHKDETGSVPGADRRKLSATFVSRLVGADILRVLLGLEGASAIERRNRAQSATDELLAGLQKDRYGANDSGRCPPCR